MHGPGLEADIVAGILAIAIPLSGPIERRIYRSSPNTSLKTFVYGVNAALLSALVVAVVSIDGWRPLFVRPAAGAAWLWAPAVSSPLLSIVVVGYVIVGIMPLVQSLRGPRWRRAYAVAFRRSTSDIPGLLPNNAIERAAWIPLSLTAGLCEEVLCRGFLIRFLHEGGLSLPLAAALVVASLIFGLCHAYQGFKGVLYTTVAGLAFGLLFLLSGNLLASIVVHTILDLQVAYVLRPLPEDKLVTAGPAACVV